MKDKLVNRIDRLFAILLLLQTRRRLRAVDLAKRFEISERTVYRDMAALQQMGVPVIAEAGFGYAMMQGFYLPPLVFSPAEARSLLLAVKMLRASGNLPAEAEAAADKIAGVLPEHLREQVIAQARTVEFHEDPPHMTLETPQVRLLQQAILEKRTIWLRYHSISGDETSERRLDPYTLGYSAGAWYVSGYCHLREELRSFRLDRVESLRLLAEHFEARQIEPGQTQPWTEVEVRFDLTVARWLRERQHYAAINEHTEVDGLHVHYRVHSLDEIRNWLLGWGAVAEVLHPPQLRQQIRDEARRVFELLT